MSVAKLRFKIAGGAKAAQQYLSAGLVDEMEISMVPMLLGAGERLFDGARDLGGLRLVRTVAAPDVTHLKFALQHFPEPQFFSSMRHS